MAEHLLSNLKILGKGAPEVTKLQNGRYRIEFRCTGFSRTEDWYADNIEGRLFAEFGSLMDAAMGIEGLGGSDALDGVTYDNMRLRENRLEYTPNGELVVYFMYETVSGTFVQTKDDDVDFQVSGLRRVKRQLIATVGTTYSKVVGVDQINHVLDGLSSKSLYLTNVEIIDDDTARTVNETWIEAGLIRTSETPGPIAIPGTTRVTWVSTGNVLTPTGVLIEQSDDNAAGFTTYTRTTLQGTITGIKQTYKDIADIRVPGVVVLDLEEVSITDSLGTISGTIAVPKVTPVRTAKQVADVTVEITTTPPTTAAEAFDLGAISCSVTSTNEKLDSDRTKAIRSDAPVLVATGWRRSYSASARMQVYPGCYISGDTEVKGEVSYQSRYAPYKDADGNISSETSTSISETSLYGTGSTAATGYDVTGIIRRRSRPVLTALDGTIYYEVITWSV